jgi:hypothetical protein
MLKYLIPILVASTMVKAQQQPAAASAEYLQTAYSLCTKRYIEHDPEKKKTAKWQTGFENCDKIVAAHDKPGPGDDRNQHKSKIDAIAASIK